MRVNPSQVMNLPRVYKTEAVVIKRIKLGEADRILTLFTPNYGKMRTVAKGVRKPSSRLSGHVELLTHAAMLLAHGQNLDIVTQSQTIHGFLPIRESLELTTFALYAAELVEQFTPEHMENYPLYTLLLGTLQGLSEGQNPVVLLRYFELELLSHVGYRPQLEHCVRCNIDLEPVVNQFSVSAGGVLCPTCAPTDPLSQPVSVNALKVLRLLQRGGLERCLRLYLSSGLLEEMELLLRRYLEYLLEHRLKSVRFLDELKAGVSQQGSVG